MSLPADEIARLFRGSATPPPGSLPGEPPATTRPELVGTFGMVATTHWQATAAGMAVLERGGNAFDAAIAGAFVLQVVEPSMCGPAGDVPIIVSAAGSDAVKVICGQGVAPQAATIGAFRDLGLDLVPGAGFLPAVVPGAFDAYMLLLRDWGTLPVREVMAPAIALARNGHVMGARLSATIGRLEPLFSQHWTTSAAVYLPGGRAPVPNKLFRNTALADTYDRIVREAEAAGGSRERQIEGARDAWYRGFVAEAIERFCRETDALDTSGRHHRGLMRADDLARWSATVEEPLSYDYDHYTVHKCGPWSQGPAFLQQLALLKGFDIGAMDPNGAEFIHTVTECTKLAFADREKFYADPAFVDVPFETLLSDSYNDARRRLVAHEASGDIRPGAVTGHGGAVRYTDPDGRWHEIAGDGSAGAFDRSPAAALPSGDTVHLDVADKAGNMVSMTPSGGWLRSSPVIPELGFPLGNRGQIFSLDEGAVGALAPGKRPRTTLSPGFAHRDGTPYMAFGTPGADKQDQWALQFFLRHVHHGLNLQAAIDAPTFHTEHFPGSFYPKRAGLRSLSVESRIDKAAADDLKSRGHDLKLGEPWSQGRMCAVTREDGVIRAAASSRTMQPYAFGR